MTAANSNTRQKRIDLAHLGEAGEIGVIVGDSFNASDLTLVASSAERAGFRTRIISAARSLVSGKSETGEEMNFVVDSKPDEAEFGNLSGLFIPGGATSVAQMSADQDVRLIIIEAIKAGTPLLAMHEGVDLLGTLTGKDGVTGEAALGLNGDVFTASGEDALHDATGMFLKAMNLAANAA